MGGLLQNRLVLALIMIAAGLFAAVIAGMHHSELIAPINLNLQTAMIAAGIFLGLCLSYVLATSRARTQGSDGALGRMSNWRYGTILLMMPVLGGLGGSYAARRAVEAFAFDDIVPVRSMIDVRVVGTGTHKSNPYVVVEAVDGGRRFEIAATWAAYQAAQSTHEKLTLPLETGRDGLQRVLLPPARLAPADLIPDR